MSERAKKWTESLFAEADININGDRPWDLHVKNDSFYSRVLRQGSIGLGEAYMDGWWDVEELDQFFYKLLKSRVVGRVKTSPYMALLHLSSFFTNRQKASKAFVIGERHYDIGNDVYQAMLDSRLTYTCGYWKDANTLNEAQEAKLDIICRKLGLEPGMSVLDIGCGWGSFAKFAAEKYGVSVTGVTVSKEQIALGNKLCEGLPVELRLQDYRDIDEKFDRVVSVGMFEHVGHKNYRIFMDKVKSSLHDDGLFLLHTIGNNRSVTNGDPWTDKYIFPGGMLPSVKQIGASIENTFVIEDWHNFGADYDKTLMAWFANFDEAWPKLKNNYDDRFYRMWKYYLLSFAGGFRARKPQLWQIVLSPEGVLGGYESLRD